MEVLSTGFFAALLAIVIIDLVLAGDNAIVIALAARNLPRHLQKRAIVWGALGAIVVRSSMTGIVVWLLKIPGLLLLGGALLVFIAYRLLRPEQNNHNGAATHAPAAMTFLSAMRTIVVADAVMGLDNVLAVAGAAHGSYLLVVMGLLISIPIVIWGSTLLLRFVERVPAVVYLGAGVLAWTAVKMITAEPLVKPWLAEYPVLTTALYLAIIPGVLWAGFVKNHRQLESRIHARLAHFARERLNGKLASSETEGESTMMRVLIPVDGSRNAEHAVRHAVKGYLKNHELEIHLLNVQPPFSRNVAAFVRKRDRDDYHREQAELALAGARGVLEQYRVPHHTHVAIGERAPTITDTAKRLKCHHIVIGTARKNSLTRMLQDSVTNRVLELTTVPVEIVAGDEISNLERYGIAAAIATAIGLLLLALD